MPALVACGGATGGAAATGPAYVVPAEVKASVEAAYNSKDVAPEGPSVTPLPNQSIWIVSCGEANVGCATPAKGALEAARAAGMTATVCDGNFGVGDAFNVCFRQAIAAGATGIVSLIECPFIPAAYQAAKDAGIPVVSQAFDCDDPNSKTPGAPLFSTKLKWNAEYETTAEFRRASGELRADWSMYTTDGKAQAIMLDQQGAVGPRYISEGFTQRLATCTSCSVSDSIGFSAQDLQSGALKQMFSSSLAANPNANVVFAPYDPILTAAEAPQALRATGRAQQTKVIGGDGYTPNLDLIRQGIQTADLAFDANWLGWGMVDTLIRVENGQEGIPMGLSYTLIDATHNLPPEGAAFTSKVDYRAAYLGMWGRT
ncbi:sugar ABC transporter substrate-binding protein [Pseudonocardia pini]|uniref:sugar ABC transporter substrate-binding protein n=1 Tax=Pseudonocardia pini TaxID=2758030 RepID=UPI0015F06F3A|nr:substrate-binding domain-containing protein [Pseudonocardia pini]